MGRPANGGSIELAPALIGLMLPFYGTDGDLEPGWVISDGTIQNGFQTIAYPDDTVPMQFSTSSNNVWGGSYYNGSVNRPVTDFVVGTDGSAHTHKLTAERRTDDENVSARHKHPATNLKSKTTETRNMRNIVTAGRASGNGTGSRAREHFFTDIDGGIVGNLPGGSHNHGVLSNNESLDHNDEISVSDPTKAHGHIFKSNVDVTTYPSMTIRVIVFVGYE